MRAPAAACLVGSACLCGFRVSGALRGCIDGGRPELIGGACRFRAGTFIDNLNDEELMEILPILTAASGVSAVNSTAWLCNHACLDRVKPWGGQGVVADVSLRCADCRPRMCGNCCRSGPGWAASWACAEGAPNVPQESMTRRHRPACVLLSRLQWSLAERERGRLHAPQPT